MGVLALTGTVAEPQNDEKGLRRLGIVWLNLPQCKKIGIRTVFLITSSCLLGFHQEYLQYI